MKEAFGSESRRLRASPSIKSYWLRCASSAMTMMLRRFDNSGAWKARPLLHPRYGPPFSSGMNFWMVVKTTPPLATLSSLRRCSTESANSSEELVEEDADVGLLEGVLYGIEGGGDDGDDDSNRQRWLVTIDSDTGAAVELGETVGNLNALAFVPQP